MTPCCSTLSLPLITIEVVYRRQISQCRVPVGTRPMRGHFVLLPSYRQDRTQGSPQHATMDRTAIWMPTTWFRLTSTTPLWLPSTRNEASQHSALDCDKSHTYHACPHKDSGEEEWLPDILCAAGVFGALISVLCNVQHVKHWCITSNISESQNHKYNQQQTLA